jgi:hypothetical protein
VSQRRSHWSAGEEFLAFLLMVSSLATVVTRPFLLTFLIGTAYDREVYQILGLALSLAL